MASQQEWAAHGTSYSTLEPACVPPGSPTGAEAVAFFEQRVALFQTLPTHNWLEKEGITPSTTQTYTLSQLNSARSAASGVHYRPAGPKIRHYIIYGFRLHANPRCCSGSMTNSNSWQFNRHDSLLDGPFIPIGKRTIAWHLEPCVDGWRRHTLRSREHVHQVTLNILRCLRAAQRRIVMRRCCSGT